MITVDELYDFLEDCPTEWEVTQDFEGVRWVRFVLEEEYEDE